MAERDDQRDRVHRRRRDELAEHDPGLGRGQRQQQLVGALLALLRPESHAQGRDVEEQQVRKRLAELIQAGQAVQEEAGAPERSRGAQKNEQRDEDVARWIAEIASQVALSERIDRDKRLTAWPQRAQEPSDRIATRHYSIPSGWTGVASGAIRSAALPVSS